MAVGRGWRGEPRMMGQLGDWLARLFYAIGDALKVPFQALDDWFWNG